MIRRSVPGRARAVRAPAARARAAAALLVGAPLIALPGCEAPQPDARTVPLDVRAYDPQTDSLLPMSPPPAPRTTSTSVIPEVALAAPRVTLGDPTVYSFEFRDTPATDALRLIADRADLNFVIPTDLAGLVSASLPRVTLDQAIDVVLEQTGMSLVETEGVYSVTPRPEEGLITRLYQPQSVDLATIAEQMKAIAGDNGLSVNPQANLAYVVGPAETIAQMDEFMAAIDMAPREVLIEARILEVSLDEGFERGVAATIQDISIGDSSSTFVTNFLQSLNSGFSIATVADKYDLDAALQAVQSFGRLHVIASPRVIALNQETAKIEIIEKVPYVQATATTTGDENGVSSSTVEEVEFEEVGIKLHVTPALGESEEITLRVDQEVSEVINFFKSIPVTDNRKVDTRFVVNDRETIVIGGLLKERTRDDESGIPYLMDIPWLGALFSGKTTVREKVELLVLITPRIVRQGELAGVASEYKREYWNKSDEYRQGKYREFVDDVR